MFARNMIRVPLMALLAAGAAAAPTREPTLAERYVRISAANAAGDVGMASAQMAALLARDPANMDFALRAYRQALAAGDRPLATRAAASLDRNGALPADGPLLLMADAVRARDWKRARAAVDRLEQGRLFAFLAPLLRGWIALAARDADPFAAAAPARASGIAASYYPEQHALLLLAAGKAAEGARAVRALPGGGPTRLRLLAAAALLGARDQAGALALLAGDEQPLVDARARLAAGTGPGLAAPTPYDGMAELLAHVALDFNRQRLAPVATVMARLATFVAPDNGDGWIVAAQVMAAAKRPEAALAALARVAPTDPYAGLARTMRVALLIDQGDRQRALDEAARAARRPGAGAAEWARAGDVSMALERPGDAAAAYAKAIALAGSLPPGRVWPLWLQQGGALELAGDWPGAKAALAKAYALAPDQPVVLNHLGYSQLARRENVAEAEALIARASALRPDDPAITDSLGWSRFLVGRASEAVPILERAAAGDPGEPTINEHLGDVYWTVGRRLEARYAWRAALVTAEDKDKARLTSKIDDGLTLATASP